MGAITEAVAQQKKQSTGLRAYIEKNANVLTHSLPKDVDPVKFVRDVFTAVSMTPKLQECNVSSVMGAFATSAQLGLMPNNSAIGEAWIIPYGKQAQFQLGYQGAITLAYRNKKVLLCFAREVRDTDFFDIDLGSGYVKHTPCLTGKSGKIIGYYAVLKLAGDVQLVEYMSQEDMDDFRKRYVKKSDAWSLSPEAMSKKTVLKRVLKYAPRSLEMQESFALDETERDEESVSAATQEAINTPGVTDDFIVNVEADSNE